MRQKSTIKRLVCLAFVFIFAFATILPVSAMDAPTTTVPASEQPYRITVKNNDNLPPMEAGQYTAYQIFSGEVLYEDNANIRNIQWGKDIDGDKLVQALKELMNGGLDADFATLKAKLESTLNKADSVWNHRWHTPVWSSS